MNRADKEAADQIKNACKVCKAAPGQPCVTGNGDPLGGVHAFGNRRDLKYDFVKLTRNEEVDK
jgi:hypothetical protein